MGFHWKGGRKQGRSLSPMSSARFPLWALGYLGIQHQHPGSWSHGHCFFHPR